MEEQPFAPADADGALPPGPPSNQDEHIDGHQAHMQFQYEQIKDEPVVEDKLGLAAEQDVKPEEGQEEEFKAEDSLPPPVKQEDGGVVEAPPAEPPKRKRASKWEDPAPEPVGFVQGGDPSGGPPLPPPPPRRHKWGPSMDPTIEAAEKKRKKRSRWEDNPEQTSQAIVVAAPAGMSLGNFSYPKEVQLSCGIMVKLPSNMIGDSGDPRIRALHEQLREVERKIDRGVLDIPPEGQRSPSPEPVYDRNGVRLNTREIRHREKLIDSRHRLIEELMREDPAYKPPADYKPRKFSAKVRIPQDEYPHYNFIGLLIGPRGNTQKRMQQETNTKIAIRGRGSVKEGSNKDPKYDYGEDEELHVLVTGNTQADVDRAVTMVELLCRPDDDSLNEHKRLQLRELAALNGTLKDEVACPICGDFTHRGYECPTTQQQLYVLPDVIKQKVEEQYQRDVARVRGTDAVASEDDYKTFLKELGGAPPPELMGELGAIRRGLGAGGFRGGRDVSDECKLYVGSLPASFTDSQLKAMFDPFGTVTHASIVMDQITGQSRCFGFVHYEDAATARAASEAMHNKQLEGRSLVVRVRSDPVEPRGPRGPQGPTVHDNVNTLYVTALNPSVTEASLRGVFEAFGRVVDCRMIFDRVTGMSRGYAFVTMSSAEEVAAAITGGNGYQLEGRNIVVKKAGMKGDGGDSRGGGYPGGGGGGAPHGGGGWGGGPRGGPHMHYPPPGPYGMPPPHHYGGPPPPYAGPPPPYGAPYGAPPPGPYGAPPPPYGYSGYPPPGYGGYGYPGQPPVPGSEYGAQPPLPSEPAPPPAPPGAPGDQGGMTEYERFLLEMQNTIQPAG